MSFSKIVMHGSSSFYTHVVHNVTIRNTLDEPEAVTVPRTHLERG